MAQGSRRRTLRVPTAFIAAGVALALAALHPPAARAGIPARGTIVEGVGPAAAPIGSTRARLQRAWGALACPGRPGTSSRRCYTSLRWAINWVELEGDGRVSAFGWGEPGWLTRRGVGVGSAISKVRAAYGSALKVRKTPVWTYIDLVTRVRGETRVTSFLGRTKVGDIRQVVVYRKRARTVRAPAGPVAPGTPLEIALEDFPPLSTVELEIGLPWQRLRESLGTTRIGRNAKGRLVVPGGGIVERLRAQRPAGTAGPVTARIYETETRGPRATVRLLLPSPPAMSLEGPALTGTAPVGLRLTGVETGATYAVEAEWTCPTGIAGRFERAVADSIFTDRPAPALVVTVDSQAIVDDIFLDQTCVGSVPPPEVQVTLLLFRMPPDARGAGRERLGELRVPARSS